MRKKSDFVPGFVKGDGCVVYVGDDWFANVRKWLSDNGHAREERELRGDGCLATRTNWGSAERHITAYIAHLRGQRWSSWPRDASELCEKYEKRLHEVDEKQLQYAAAVKEKDEEIERLRSRLEHARREADSAKAVACEMRKRAAEADPDNIRRQVELGVEHRVGNLTIERNALAAELHEAKSQIAKLAEDKRRLRLALNTARGR